MFLLCSIHGVPTNVSSAVTNTSLPVDFLNRFEKDLRRMPLIAAAEVPTALVTGLHSPPPLRVLD
jgi:hypothetical protein